MRSRRLRQYLPAVLLLLGFVAVRGTREQRAVPLAGPLDGVLAGLEGYRIENQRVSAEEQKVAGMTDYVARVYRRDTTVAFTTYVGYYDRQTQGKTIHSPRNCLPGAGWEILRSGTAAIASASGAHTVNRYVLKNGTTRALVYYWYQGRGRVAANEYAVKLNLLRDAALKGHTEEALVRIVIPIPNSDAGGERYARADELGRRLASRLMDDVQRVLPSADAGTRRLAVAPPPRPVG